MSSYVIDDITSVVHKHIYRHYPLLDRSNGAPQNAPAIIATLRPYMRCDIMSFRNISLSLVGLAVAIVVVRTYTVLERLIYHQDVIHSITEEFTAATPLYEKEEIKQWGCQRRHDAPFIFVHIGKAGGGGIRPRFAASALNYKRELWHKFTADESYYPVQDKDGTIQRGVFVNSHMPNYRPSFDNMTQTTDDETWWTFEGTLPCAAQTPLGQAIACPLLRRPRSARYACHGDKCAVVYTGHNLLGNEMHWLPDKYLQEWWRSSPWYDSETDLMTMALNNRMKPYALASAPCYFPKTMNKTVHVLSHYKANYVKCAQPLERVMDDQAKAIFRKNNLAKDDWSVLYASMPVLRVTMLREPFAWLVSKFFWHSKRPGYLLGKSGTKWVLDSCDNSHPNEENPLVTVADWVSYAAMNYYILPLCGEDCVVRLNANTTTLDEIEKQARHNLQRSFAVVGLLNETQTFYDMVTARTAYVNTSLHRHVQGHSHKAKSSGKDDPERCRQVFSDPTFQKSLLDLSPEMRALKRLYQVGLQVNQAQLQEMEFCGTITVNSSHGDGSEKRRDSK